MEYIHVYERELPLYLCLFSSILELAVDIMKCIVTHTDVRRLEGFCTGRVVDG
jgi:hypothetical protein